MNNKGQTLVVMIILVPLIILLFGSIIESVNVYYQKHHAISVTKTIITKALLKNEKDDIIKLYDDNKIEALNLKVDYNEGMNVSFSFRIDSFLGKMINKDYYEVNINITGYLNNDKVEFKKG